jgi:hypothetical protein
MPGLPVLRTGGPSTKIEQMKRSFMFAATCLVCLVTTGAAQQVGGRPDFTGVWGVYREPGQTGRAGGGPQSGATALREAAAASVEDYQRLVAPNGDTPGGFCLGSGMPGSMLGSGGYPMEIVQHDDVIVVIYEAHSEVRHIYLGEPADEADLFPDRNGYSVGQWDGDRLIVTTTHLKEAVDQRQFPHSENAVIVETYSLDEQDDGTKVLTAEMTMTDPDFYERPVSAVKRWTYLPGVRLLPYECNEPLWEEHLEQLREAAGTQH